MPPPVVVSVLADLSNYQRGMAQVGQTADKTQGKFRGLGQAVSGALASAAVFRFGQDSVKAFGESAQAQASLNNALRNSPATVGVTSEAFAKFNSTLAKTTLADDDALAAGQAVLANFGLTETQLKSMSPVIADVAAKMGTDIPTAAEAVGKALLGNSKGLKSLGIDYKATGNLTLDLANLQGILAAKTAGAAQAQLDAATPGDKLNKSMDELKETVGSKLVPALQSVADVGIKVSDWLSTHPEAIAMAGAVGTLAGAVWGINAAVKAWAATQLALNTQLGITLTRFAPMLGAAGIVGFGSVDLAQDLAKDDAGWKGKLNQILGAGGEKGIFGKKFLGISDATKDLDEVKVATDGVTNAQTGLGIATEVTAGSMVELSLAMDNATAAGKAMTKSDAWATDFKRSLTSMLDPLKKVEEAATKTGDALSLNKVRELMNNDQEWEAEWRKLSASAKAGLGDVEKAVKKTVDVFSLGDLQKGLTKSIKEVTAWERDLKSIATRDGGKFAPLAAELSKLGPDAAAAVDEATRMGSGGLSKLQDQFIERGRLMSDSTIKGFQDSIGGPAITNVGIEAVLLFGKGWISAVPKIASDTGNILHDALLGGSPVLTPAEASLYLGLPSWLWDPSGKPLGITGPTAPAPAASGPAASPQPTVSVTVNAQTNASPREIAAESADAIAWRLHGGSL